MEIIHSFIDSRIQQRDFDTAIRLKWLSISDLEADELDRALTHVLLSTCYCEGSYKEKCNETTKGEHNGKRDNDSGCTARVGDSYRPMVNLSAVPGLDK